MRIFKETPLKGVSLQNTIIVIAVVYLLGFFAHAFVIGKTVYGDGIYYYSWLRSTVVDGDINFANEYAGFGATQQLTTKGLLGNIYSVGPAMLWLPQFLLTHRLLNDTGFTLPYQLTVGLTSVLYALVGLLLLHQTLAKLFSKTIARLTTLAIAFATNVFFYGSLDTVNSHALSFFAASLFVALITNRKTSPLTLGANVGLLALIRPQDALFGLLVLPFVIARIRQLAETRQSLRLLAGFLLAFLPQLLAWQLLYGKFWVSPYLDRGYGFNFLQPHLLDVLFSPRSGLLLWTPIVAIALAGFFLKGFPKAVSKWPILLLIFLELYLVASWTTWWQGASFSGRMFISLLPFLSIGLATVFKKLQSLGMKPFAITLSIILPLSAINVLLMLFFLLAT